MTKDIIDSIASGDNIGAETHFKNALSQILYNRKINGNTYSKGDGHVIK